MNTVVEKANSRVNRSAKHVEKGTLKRVHSMLGVKRLETETAMS